MEDILVERDGHVLTITLNRPKVLNALREQTVDELLEVLLDVARDPSVGVVVIAGSGSSFCSGFDAHIMADIDSEHLLELFYTRNMRLSSLLQSLPQPVIAQVHGWCVGGGYELALFCDLIVADESATFYCSGVNSGSSPVWGATQLLGWNVGEKRAREIVYTTSKLSAIEAEDMGLINAAVPVGELTTTVQQWCGRLLEMSPGGLRLSKRTMNAVVDIQVGLLSACEFSATSAGAETRYGYSSFLSKAVPDFEAYRSGQVGSEGSSDASGGASDG